ncbi:hypothetical protein [Natronomonas sp. EA1]|uniref:hypothetical protein n=1 Tax=Natronomonas sp. EA1 TaxID=3421655 RepID=UPI003EBF32A6
MSTRRRFLGGIGLGTASALAGCLGYRGTRGDRAPATDPLGPAPGADTIARWTYDPAIHGTDTGAVFFLDRERALSVADAMPPATARKYAGYLDSVPLPGEVAHGDVRAHLLVHAREGPRRAAVLFGEFGDGSGTLAADHSLNNDGPIGWESSDGALVVAPDDALAATLAAGQEGRDRWSGDPLVAEALAALGPGDDVSLVVHPVHDADPANARFDGGRVRGHRYVFGPESSRSRYVFGFESAEQAARADVDAWLATARFADYGDIVVRRAGRIVVVDGTLPTHAV